MGPLFDIVWDLYLILSTCKNGQIRSAGRSGSRPVGKTGNHFFHVLGYLELICKKNVLEIFIQKMKLSCHRNNMIKWMKIFCKSTPNGPKREKTVANFANRSAAGPSGGPNLTIFAGRQYQIKVPYRVSLNSIQKYGLGPQRRICCNHLPILSPL